MYNGLIFLNVGIIIAILSIGAIISENPNLTKTAESPTDTTALDQIQQSDVASSDILTSNPSDISLEIPSVSSGSSGRSDKKQDTNVVHEKEPITSEKREENKEKFDFTGTIQVYSQGKILSNQVYFQGTPVLDNSEELSQIENIIPSIGIIDFCRKIMHPGYYVLTRSISSPYACLQVTSPDVTIDCNGHSISFGSGLSGAGILANNADNLVVKNCKVREDSLFVQYSSDLSIWNSDNVRIKDNTLLTFSENSNAIKFNGVSDSFIQRNSIQTLKNGNGILISGTNTEISENNIVLAGEGSNGINLDNSDELLISNNRIFPQMENSNALLIQGTSNNNLISDNTIKDGFGNGIAVSLTADAENTFSNNEFVNIPGNQLNVLGRTDGTTIALVNQPIESYDLSIDGVLLNIKKTGVGEINFLNLVAESGDSLSEDIELLSNLAKVNSEEAIGLNKGAIVSLSNLPNMSNPIILRNGAECLSDICTIHTPITDEVTFEVSGWSEYSIGEAPGTAQQLLATTEENGCRPVYDCTSWTACDTATATQTRTCQSTNGCTGFTDAKPIEVQSCSVQQTQQLSAPQEQQTQGFVLRLTGAVTGFVREAPAFAGFFLLATITALLLIVNIVRKKLEK